jgi:hypothetical protein
MAMCTFLDVKEDVKEDVSGTTTRLSAFNCLLKQGDEAQKMEMNVEFTKMARTSNGYECPFASKGDYESCPWFEPEVSVFINPSDNVD